MLHSNPSAAVQLAPGICVDVYVSYIRRCYFLCLSHSLPLVELKEESREGGKEEGRKERGEGGRGEGGRVNGWTNG